MSRRAAPIDKGTNGTLLGRCNIIITTTISLKQVVFAITTNLLTIIGFITNIFDIPGERIEDILPSENSWNAGLVAIKIGIFLQILAFLVKKVKTMK